MRFSILSAAALLATAHALIPIEIKGNRFIRPALDASSDGEVFQVLGVDYQPNGASGYDGSANSDVLTHADTCLRDAFVLQQLGINTIRIYTVNPWLNHDECMSIFNAAGIYVVLDVNSPLGGESIARNDPGPSYNAGYLNRVFGIIDAFQGYPNLLGFFAGNEVVNDAASAQVAPPYVRAVIRDIKDYIALHSNRTIPVGYSAADDIALRQAMWAYLECGDDSSRADFYGLNSYQWCSGRDNFQTSGYQTLLNTFQNTAIPIFLSEFGCNAVSPRTFDEIPLGVYGPLASAFSGGLVYEYSQEANNYGLVDIREDGTVRLQQDFANLQAAYNKINLKPEAESQVSAIPFPQCDANIVSVISALDSSFNSTFDLPPCPVPDVLKNGVGNNNKGKIIDFGSTTTNYSIYNVAGNELANTSINVSPDNQINSPSGANISEQGTNGQTDNGGKSTSKSKGLGVGYEIPATGFLATLFGLVSLII